MKWHRILRKVRIDFLKSVLSLQIRGKNMAPITDSIINIPIKWESIIEAVKQLTPKERARLMQILDDELEDEVDDLLATNPRIRGEIDKAWEEYRQGNYKTLEQFQADASH